MKTKILIILIVLVCIIVGGFFVYKNMFVSEEEFEMPSVIEEKLEKKGIQPIPESILKSRFGYMAHHGDWQILQEDRERYSYLSWERAHPGFANWQEIEPRKGEYHWEKIDRYVETAQEKDIQILFTVWPFTDWDQETCNMHLKWQPNDWGKDPRDFLPLAHRKGKPCDMEAYQEFLRLLVERYDGDGHEDMPGLRYPVRYWEIGNEPDGAYDPKVGGLFFQGSVEDYFEILKVSYITIKDTDPNAKVLIAAVPSIGVRGTPEWVRPDFNAVGIFELGASKYFDVMNLHESGRSEKVREALKRYGAEDKPIWITEPWAIKEYIRRAEEENIPLATLFEEDFEKEFQYNVERIFIGGPESIDQALHEAILIIETPEEEREEIIQEEEGPVKVSNTTRKGTLFKDEIWSGEILVTDFVTVPRGITLTIEPGTIVKFKHCRDYRGFCRRPGLMIQGGVLKAVGTAEQQIWFTSDAKDPINGDWETIMISDSKNENIVKYAIVEYALLGINFWTSSGTVSNSIIRWINSECIYMERSNLIVEYNTIYNCGYNGIAMEQFNYDVLIRYNKVTDNYYNTGIHGEATKATIENNIVRNNKFGITFDDYGEAVIKNNLIENHSGHGLHFYFSSKGNLASNKIRNNAVGIVCGQGQSQLIAYNNDISENQIDFQIDTDTCQTDLQDNQEKITIPEFVFDYQDLKKTDLGYCPGDPEDKYLYIYPAEDETRRVIEKIVGGIPTSFGWSLGWDGKYLWKFRHAGGGDLMKINPESGEIITSFPNPGIAQDHGVAFDGKSLWINDFSSLKVFEVNPETGKILSSFDIPEMKGSGASGIAWDGEYLYLVSWLKQNKLYKMDQKGNLIGILELKGPTGQTITFDGQYFWMSCGPWICKYDKQGNLRGRIYAVAEGTWAMAHDGKYLWTLQRTNENWTDPKVYQIKILDDSLIK